jgi:hypothetical protein
VVEIRREDEVLEFREDKTPREDEIDRDEDEREGEGFVEGGLWIEPASG